MITWFSLLSILVFHFIFDFFFQTDKMAQGKSKNNIDLSAHVAVYTIGLVAMMILNWPFFPSFAAVAGWVAMNSVAHFFTDYFSSRASSRLYRDNEFHDFFGTIGLDQLVHYVTLTGTFIWLAK